MARKPKTEVQEPTPTRGRRATPENQKRIEHILDRVAEEPGVPSPLLAEELDITTLQCSQLADRLIRDGDIVMHKMANGVRTYYTPKAYAKVEKRLQQDFDKDMAEREATRADRASVALEKLKKANEEKPARKTRAKKTEAAEDDDLIGDAPAPRRRRAKAA